MTRLTLLFTLALGACAHIGSTASRTHVVIADFGGEIRTELPKWQARDREVDRYVLDGACESFCAFWTLSKRNTCYTENVRLWLHPASYLGAFETEATQRITDSYVSRWPWALQLWWRANRPSPFFGATLHYSDLKQIIPDMECKDAR